MWWKRRGIIYSAVPVLHLEAPDLAGVHIGKASTDGSAGAGWIAGFGATLSQMGPHFPKTIVD
jgi:hypothetical protein